MLNEKNQPDIINSEQAEVKKIVEDCDLYYLPLKVASVRLCK